MNSVTLLLALISILVIIDAAPKKDKKQDKQIKNLKGKYTSIKKTVKKTSKAVAENTKVIKQLSTGEDMEKMMKDLEKMVMNIEGQIEKLGDYMCGANETWVENGACCRVIGDHCILDFQKEMTMNENRELCQEWGGSMVEPVSMTAEEQAEFRAFLFSGVPDGYNPDTSWMGATQDPTNPDQFLFESDNSVLDPIGSCVADEILEYDEGSCLSFTWMGESDIYCWTADCNAQFNAMCQF